MKRKDGKPRMDYDYKIDELILDLLFDKKVMNPYRIKELLNQKYSRKLGWITIKRHLDRLQQQGHVKLFYESDVGNRKVRIYKLSK